MKANTVTPLEGSLRVRNAVRDARRTQFVRRSQSSRWLLDDATAEHGDSAVELVARPAKCGWAVGSHVAVHAPEGKPARYSGVQTCASVWSCAVCGSHIRRGRAEEVQQAARWWEAEQGGQFLFLTLTVRHQKDDALSSTMDVLTEAFTATINGAPWKRMMRRHGIRHWIKSQEVTFGFTNGWHAHLHVLVFVDLDGAARDLAEDAEQAWRDAEDNRTSAGKLHAGRARKAQRLTDDAAAAKRIAGRGVDRVTLREFRGWLTERWADMVVAKGGRRPSRRRGVDVRTVDDGDVVAAYIAKVQDASDKPARSWTVGQEMARADLKRGRDYSLVPLELLDVDGLTPDQLLEQRALWLEFVDATHGRRSMTWSRGLKDAAGIDEVEDEELAADEDADDAAVIVITAADWRTIRHDGEVLARILDLVEGKRFDDVLQLVPFFYPPPRPS